MWKRLGEDENLIGSEGYVRVLLQLNMVTGCFSTILVHRLQHAFRHRTIDVFAVTQELAALEHVPNSRPVSTKPARTFRHGKLRGLWHKHFFQASFLPFNVKDEWTEARLLKLIQAAAIDAPSPEALAATVAHKFVIEGLQARDRRQGLTGEWIVYARVHHRSYYLTLAGHREDQSMILQRVHACAVEFPELTHVLPRA